MHGCRASSGLDLPINLQGFSIFGKLPLVFEVNLAASLAGVIVSHQGEFQHLASAPRAYGEVALAVAGGVRTFPVKSSWYSIRPVRAQYAVRCGLTFDPDEYIAAKEERQTPIKASGVVASQVDERRVETVVDPE